MMNELRITYILTEDCNLRCKYCYVPHDASSMSYDTLSMSLRWMKEYSRSYDTIHIDAFGGEPLLEWDKIVFLINEAEKMRAELNKDIIVSIFTNLLLLDEDKINFIFEKRRFVKLSFSVDGHRMGHNCTRVYGDGSGTFDDVMSKVDLFCKMTGVARDKIGFKAVISPDNVEHLKDSALEMLGLGFKRISFGLARDDVWNKDSIAKYKNSIEGLANVFIENIDRGAWYDVLTIPILDKSRNKITSKYCGAGKDSLAIAPNGDIYPCQRFYNNRSPYKLGNVLDGVNIDSLWYKVFSKSTLDNFLGCSKCEDFPNYNCPGQCMAAMYEASGNIFKPIPSVCELIKINTEQAHRVYETLKDNPNYQKTLNHNKYGG